MPYNRELLAAIKLEPKSSTAWLEEPHDKVNDYYSNREDRSVDQSLEEESFSEDGKQNEATKNVIRCLKVALKRGIYSISLPEKRRPLNPKKDFTIETSMQFAPSSSRSFSCCGAGATQVKQRRQRAQQLQVQHIFSPGNEQSSTDIDWRNIENAVRGTYPEADEESALSETVRRTRSHLGREQSNCAFSSDDDDELDFDDEPPVAFTFVDYSPMCYRHIREFFHVDAKKYGEVLCNSRWHSIPTPGKSAAQLFFCGRDWVIKTMTNQESEFLRQILHRYYYHVRDNPYTLLPHFVGHHRLEIGTETHNFIIMQNVFATTNTIHEKFDLKGSTIGRFASDAEKQRATCTQKDLDINSPVHVGNERRALLIDQIKKDCDFLKRSKIMDYSFLVGIHTLPSRAAVSTQRPSLSSPSGPSGILGQLPRVLQDTVTVRANATSAQSIGTVAMDRADATIYESSDTARTKLDGRCFIADEGGMMSSKVPGLRQEIYYIGIIDILQEYNTRKTLENVWFGTLSDRERISCVNPKDYATRFISFVSSIIV